MAALAKIAPILSAVGGGMSALSGAFPAKNPALPSNPTKDPNLGNFGNQLSLSTDTPSSLGTSDLSTSSPSNTLNTLSTARPSGLTQPGFGQSRYHNALRG